MIYGFVFVRVMSVLHHFQPYDIGLISAEWNCPAYKKVRGFFYQINGESYNEKI